MTVSSSISQWISHDIKYEICHSNMSYTLLLWFHVAQRFQPIHSHYDSRETPHILLPNISTQGGHLLQVKKYHWDLKQRIGRMYPKWQQY